jgi:hypothetical protein
MSHIETVLTRQLKRHKAARALISAASSLAFLLLLTIVSANAQTQKIERGWQLLTDREGALKLNDLSAAQNWRNARVGLSWNAQFADLRDYMGAAWYRTTFDAPRLIDGRRALLKFGAVDYYSEVYVNGKRVGAHEGGYTPFEFDVTDAVKPGGNQLVVHVIDPPMDEKEGKARFPEMLYNEIPHGKQNWYVQTGGIWQDVMLEIRPRIYINQVHITQHTNGEFQINVGLSGGNGFVGIVNQDLSVKVRNPNGKFEFTKTMRARDLGGSFSGQIEAPQLWSPASPSLYTVEVNLGDESKDTQIERFGFRSFEARDGKFYLNNEPFYMIAALDQDFYPEGIYTPPSEEFVRDEMLKGKRMGLNVLRCHIKVPDPVYLKVADEVGMLVWYEIPSWNDINHFTPKAAERGERIFAEQVARDWNHPSLVIQSVINESWGADLKQANQRQWLRAAYDRAKQLTAPLNRLIVDNSACCNNFHVKTDIADFHQYFSIPDNHANWDKWVSDFATRPKWIFSSHGDAAPTNREPLVVSEFGNWGLPKLPKELPWWFGRDFGGRPVTRPAGVLERFKAYKFNALFADFNRLAEETEWHQFISLKHEIEEMRRHNSIQGYVITEFTDINWEANGLMDMYRNPKAYAAELAKIQQPDVVLARFPKNNYRSGEQVELATLISHYSNKELNNARVSWKISSGARGSFVIGKTVARASVEPLSTVSFVAPNASEPRREKLFIEVRARNQTLIAENSYELFIFPKNNLAPKSALVFHDAASLNAPLAQKLSASGYNMSGVNSAAGNKELMIATVYDSAVENHLRGGGRAILLVNSKEAVPESWSFKVAPRAGSDLDGNWVTNFNWIKRDAAPFRSVAFTPLLGFEAVNVIPRYVIQNVRPEDYKDVLSGIFYGWLNSNAALALQMQVGNRGGKALVTTFRFDEYGTDPYATRLLDEMIRYASGTDFSPLLNMP